MFCPNCGKKIPETAKFCGFCGTKIERNDPIPQNQETVFSDDVAQTVASSSLDDGKGEVAVKPRRSRKLPLILAMVLVLLVVLAGLIGFVVIPVLKNMNWQGGNLYVSISDEGYMLTSDLDEWEPILVSSDQSEPIAVSYDPSGRYLYFFTNQDSSSGTATLMRAEYGKLKAGAFWNKWFIKKVAENVSLYGVADESGEYLMYTQDGSLVFFKDANNTLCSYDGKEVQEIDHNVGSCWYLAQEDRLLYLATPSGAQNATLYLTDPKDPDQRTVLAPEVQKVLSHDNPDEIFYTVLDPADNNRDLYLTGINRTPVLLASDMPGSWDLVFSNTANQYFYYAISEQSSQFAGDSGYTLYSLNTLQDGTPVCVQDKIWRIYENEGVFFYNVWAADEPMESVISLRELESTGKIHYYAYDIESGRCVPLAQGLVDRMESDFGTIQNVTLAGDNLFISCYDSYLRTNTILAAWMDQDVISGYQVLTNSGQIYCVSGGEMYYITTSFERDGDYYVYLYRYGEGGQELLMDRVIATSIVVYEDGVILASTNRDSEYPNVVMRTREGKLIPVAENVERCIRVDPDTMLYLSGDSLYCFDGQQRKRIAQNIHMIESKEELSFDSFDSLSF